VTKDRDKEPNELVDDFFGGCPVCGRNDGFINIYQFHWFFCDQHKVKWLRGSNLFGCWQFQTPEDWQHGQNYLATYVEVAPVFSFEELLRCKDGLKR
jgi:hypothetical protein